MKLYKTVAVVGKHGRITLQTGMLDAAGLKPGDEVKITLAVKQDETESLLPEFIVTPNGLEVAVQLTDRRKDNEEIDLTLPNELLEAAEIPEGSDLEIICAAGAIVIMEANILDNLPDDLRELFDMLGIDPGTVRAVMRKEGYFV